MTTTSTTTPHSELYDAGLAMRKTVLGDAYVDKALSAVTEFGQPMQDLVTEYCWGGIWTREGLDRRTRSLLNLVMLTALNRQTEFSTHVRGARANGVTDEEIQEALLQTAVYVGVTAALEAFRNAERVLRELDAAEQAD
ncbi:carboxymuconolactone decarboxylase family protein [Gordonia sp. C13]|uniref:carboxymuconolactone decarboxylase family protein n=1 Tax=Gordonia sp. C13 TaxID=2935078 RepID=UPI00200A1797|nr:carboxymuconolactone decarboxylase family protein [Gordonia sp. C13]MCK8614053.1 carboxymuconolactone decarboxylase family protein [Gordonia sp. C13]